MKRRQIFPAMAGLTGIIALDWLKSRPAVATILNDLFDSATGYQTSPASRPSSFTSSAPVAPSTDFAEIYGENYITREQFTVLQSGNATHWWDIAPKPYARMNSDPGSERYYFPFAFGDGGVIVVCDTAGAIVNWDITGDPMVPEYSPDDLSEYNYYPPKAKEVAVESTPTGFPPVPPNAPVSQCY